MSKEPIEYLKHIRDECLLYLISHLARICFKYSIHFT